MYYTMKIYEGVNPRSLDPCTNFRALVKTSRKVEDSKPDKVNFFFSILPNPFGRTRPFGLLSQ
jgi:hypothetical protein